MQALKIMLIGYGRAGKGTFCDIAKEFGLTASSSSHRACELGAFDHLAKKHGFASANDFYPERHIDRNGCFEAIVEYNGDVLTRLGDNIFAHYNIYDGCRNHLELEALRDKQSYDLAIWVDGGDRIPPEPATSMTVTRDHADIAIFNEGDQAVYEARVRNLLRTLTAGRV